VPPCARWPIARAPLLPDRRPSLRDWRDAYYRENLGRLEGIRKQADPGRLFDFPLAI
jgi:hypothetical protein